jgi:hypothetical protein
LGGIEKMNGKWINTDEAEDVAGSIRHVIRCAQFIQADPQAYKWALLALHSALQGACVAHLTTTEQPLGAVTDRNAKEWRTFHEASRMDPSAPRPKTYLMGLPDLLKAIRKPHSAGDRSNGLGVTVNDSELANLRHFNDDLRNQFVHFKPMGWSIELSGVPELVRLTARIINEILQFGWAFRHQDDEWHIRIRTDLDRMSALEWAA